MGIAATLSMSLLASALLLVIVRVTRAKAGRSHV